MTRYRVILLLFILALIGALSTRRELYWSLAGALLALLVFSVAWAWVSINWLRFGRRTLTPTAMVGQELEEEFTLTNLSALPKLWVEVRDQSDLPHHYASRVVGWLPGRKLRGWRTRTVCTQRGHFSLGPVQLTSGDPLGVFQRTRALDRVNHVLVYPAVFDLPAFPLRTTTVPGGDALRKRAEYVTTNASGVRDYVNGDSLNRIHWPLSIRRQKLTVKEFELDPTTDYWIVLDLQFLAQHALPQDERAWLERPNLLLPPSTEEYVVSLGASVARHFLNAGRQVGLVAWSRHRELIQPDRGERQLNKILEMLAMVRAHGDVPFARVVRAEGQGFARGSTAVLISASSDVEWAARAAQLGRSGARVLSIVVDAATFGGPKPADEVVGALEQGGVLTRRVKYGDAFAQALA